MKSKLIDDVNDIFLILRRSLIFAFNSGSLQIASLVVMAMVGNMASYIMPVFNAALVYAGVLYIFVTSSSLALQGLLSRFHREGNSREVDALIGGGIYSIALCVVLAMLIVGISLPSLDQGIDEKSYFLMALFFTALPLGINSLMSVYLESSGEAEAVSLIRTKQIILQIALVYVALFFTSKLGRSYVCLLPISYIVSDVLTTILFLRKLKVRFGVGRWLVPSIERMRSFMSRTSLSGIGGVAQKLSFMLLVAHVTKFEDTDVVVFFVMTSIFLLTFLPMSGIPGMLAIEIGKYLAGNSAGRSVRSIRSLLTVYAAEVFLICSFSVMLMGFLARIFVSEVAVIDRLVALGRIVILYFFMNHVLYLAMAFARGVGNNNKSQAILASIMIGASLLIFSIGEGVFSMEYSVAFFSLAGCAAGLLVFAHSMMVSRIFWLTRSRLEVL